MRPSDAQYWSRCPGYYRGLKLSKSSCDADSTHAENGITLHNSAKRELLDDSRSLLEQHSGYVEYVDSITNESTLRFIEQSVDCSEIHSGMKGVPDAFVFDPVQNLLTIPDAKFGFIPVSPRLNPQLMCYYTGIKKALGVSDAGLTIDFVIFQPNDFQNGPVKKWTVEGEDLRPHINNLHHAAALADTPDGPFKAGFWCKNCKARINCQTSITMVLELYQSAMSLPINEIKSDKMGLFCDVIDEAYSHINDLKKMADSRAESLIKAGENIDGWRLKPGLGRTVYTVDESKVKGIAAMFGVDPYKTSLKSPKQSGIPEYMLKNITELRPGKITLKRVSNDDIASKFEQ